jgi:hypothetical protein
MLEYALAEAIRAKQSAAASTLLERGADVNAPESRSSSPAIDPPIVQALRAENASWVRRLLPADANLLARLPVLLEALEWGAMEIIEDLINAGAPFDVEARLVRQVKSRFQPRLLTSGPSSQKVASLSP